MRGSVESGESKSESKRGPERVMRGSRKSHERVQGESGKAQLRVNRGSLESQERVR